MAYNKITVYPNQKVDYLIQITDVANSDDISKVNAANFIPDWNSFLNRTNIMARYTNDLVSSFITGLTENLSGWSVYRQKERRKQFKKNWRNK